MKECSKCWQFKPKSDFYRNKRNEDGLQPTCKSCSTKATTAAGRLKKTGCTDKKYNTLFARQKGCCAICGKHNTELKRNLAADHCHATKKVRGLLCASCNMGLGYFKDNPDLLLEAITYLKKGQ